MKRIGNYKLGKTIYSGTFGKVKLSVHIPTQQTVTIKIMNIQRLVDIIDIEIVKRELHIFKIVRHPNIIMLYEVFETTKYIFTINKCMCFILITIIRNRIYTKIKNSSQRYKTRESLNKMKNQNSCGSPCYAAPEMISRKLYSGLQADIWSSGVLFFMLCGYLPFEDANTNQLYKKILSANYKVPNFLSNDAKGVLKQILNPDPEDRQNIDQIRKHPWNFNWITQNTNRQQCCQLSRNIGIQKKYIYQCLISNQHNDATTAYYLFLDLIIQSGGQTCSDIASDQFQVQLIELNSQTANSEIKIIMTIEDEKQDNNTSINYQQIQQNLRLLLKIYQIDEQQNRKNTIKYKIRIRTIKNYGEHQKSILIKQREQKSISLSDYYSEKLSKELTLTTIYKQLKRKKPKIRTNLLTNQQVYGVIK
ncbi:unnamed protein product [Paramecium primaurelia]|uniref:Protein kinase domain-containing protein n=1 Tax=Paramecium primaurelia TaxID=5886 RepID=A0A8S1LZ86_PARPR|nr:unnamed protein product [Paramecium primaurelia]